MRIYTPPKKRRERLEKPNRKSRKIPVHPILFFFSRLSFACSVLMVLSLLSFYAYSHFQPIRSVTVHSNRILTPDFLKSLAEIDERQTFAEFDPFTASEKITSNQWVLYSRAKRLPPDRVEIHVRERTPIAFFRTKEQFFLIDEEGILLDLIYASKPWDLPVIADENIGSDIKAGEKLVSGALLNAMGLVELLRESTVLPLDSVSEIIITDPVNIELVTMPNKLRVKMGLENFPQKLLNLHYAQSEIKKNLPRVKTVDLRYYNKIVLGS